MGKPTKVIFYHRGTKDTESSLQDWLSFYFSCLIGWGMLSDDVEMNRNFNRHVLIEVKADLFAVQRRVPLIPALSRFAAEYPHQARLYARNNMPVPHKLAPA